MKLNITPPLKPSHWMAATALTDGATLPLKGEHAVDVAIIGGGFVGLWTAITIKEHEPDARVMLLEQHVCGGRLRSQRWFCHVLVAEDWHPARLL